jgi:hypothetical protein
MRFTLVLNTRSLCCAFNDSEDLVHLLKSAMLLITTTDLLQVTMKIALFKLLPLSRYDISHSGHVVSFDVSRARSFH